MDNNNQENIEQTNQEVVEQVSEEVVEQINENNTPVVEDPNDQTARTLSIISLALFFGGSAVMGLITRLIPPLSKLVSSLTGLCPLIAIVLMIIARVKSPQNKLAKITMWIYIVLSIIGVTLTIIFVVLCVNTLRSCPG